MLSLIQFNLGPKDIKIKNETLRYKYLIIGQNTSLDLNKKMIARECEFDRKRITENSKIKAEYEAVKQDLILKGILIEDTRSGSQKLTTKTESINSSRDKAAMKKAQETAAALEEELFRTKSELDKANKKLTRLEAIERYMLETGRL